MHVHDPNLSTQHRPHTLSVRGKSLGTDMYTQVIMNIYTPMTYYYHVTQMLHTLSPLPRSLAMALRDSAMSALVADGLSHFSNGSSQGER